MKVIMGLTGSAMLREMVRDAECQKPGRNNRRNSVTAKVIDLQAKKRVKNGII